MKIVDEMEIVLQVCTAKNRIKVKKSCFQAFGCCSAVDIAVFLLVCICISAVEDAGPPIATPSV